MAVCLSALTLLFLGASPLSAQKHVWSEEEKPIVEQLQRLRQLPDDVRASTTAQLAIQIRRLTSKTAKVHLAVDLASLATEGDFGYDALQEVATTLAAALRDQPVPSDAGQAAMPYIELAQLVRYEHVRAALDDPQFTAALLKLEADDQIRQKADFTLTDVHGKPWTLRSLQGKVVLVNFWATWCPPCRKEMPDLEALYNRFKEEGLVVLAISDEDASKVKPFVAKAAVTYPILLDTDRSVNKLFQIEGIPKSFVYDRGGKLVSQAIDMRTEKQFLAMLGEAGLR